MNVLYPVIQLNFRKMGEIDTKPIKSVQVALTLFGEKHCSGRHRSSHSSSSDGEEIDRGKDFEELEKDLANHKMHLEAKESEYLQLLLELEHYRKTVEELSTLVRNSEAQRDYYMEETKEARIRVQELESEVKILSDQVSESEKIKERCLQVESKLKARESERLCFEAEKERANELLKHVVELNEEILMVRSTCDKADEEKRAVLAEKEMLQEELERARMETEMKGELENQLQVKSVLIDTLQSELNEANQLLGLSDKAASDAVNDSNRLKDKVEIKSKENSDQAFYIRALESELDLIKLRLSDANGEIGHLQSEIERLRGELGKATEEKPGEKEPDKLDKNIMVSVTEDESPVKKPEQDDNQELEAMKRELEAAMSKVSEFRTRTERAVSRAEAAEKAKLTLEEQIKEWQEKKQRRRAALAAALRDDTLSSDFRPPEGLVKVASARESLTREIVMAVPDRIPSSTEFVSMASRYVGPTSKSYQPLGKILRMKF